MSTLTDTLVDERNRELERTVERLEADLLAASMLIKLLCGDANERHSAACATIQRLSDECEQQANEIDRLRTLLRDFVRHNDRYPELYHPARSWAWVEQGNTLREQARED